MGDATFLQRLFIGWNRLSVVKLVPFSEKERTNVGGQRMSAAGRRPRVLATDVILDVGASLKVI